MLHRLRLAHRLLLIYALSFVSVAVLAYGLIVEKNLAIDFAEKERRGIAYLSVVQDTLLAVTTDELKSVSLTPFAYDNPLQASAVAIAAAEKKFGQGLNTALLANLLATRLRELGEKESELTPAARQISYEQAAAAARALIARIGDNSNLILDPDLDSYYLMSITILRLPEFVTSLMSLLHASEDYDAGNANQSRDNLLLSKGSFVATNDALKSDDSRSNASLRDQVALRALQQSFASMQSSVGRLLDQLELNRAELDQALIPAVVGRTMAELTQYWRLARTELDTLLIRRIDRLRWRMAMDLGIAGFVWLVALGLILVIARQITGPIRVLASVADQVRHGTNYDITTRIRAGGEIGRLVEGFNLMLARLKHEADREKEHVAFERTAAAQRHLLESIPVIISVTSGDGRVMYSNAGSTPFGWLADIPGRTMVSILDLLHPEDRTAFLEAFQASGQVSGFEVRCPMRTGEPAWLLISARSVDYQGEAARLDVYTPISERKHAELMLARRNAVLDAIGYAATRLINTADWRSEIPEFFARLGAAADVGRVLLFEIHRDRDAPGLAESCRLIWSAPGIKPINDRGELHGIPIDQDSDTQPAEWFRGHKRGETIQLTLSETHGAGREIFEEQAILSMLSVPIVVDGELWGSLGFDDCQTERLWDEREVDLLKAAAALIAGAIERGNSEDQIRERDNRLVEAQRIANLGIWELDLATRQVTWSDEGWRIFGLQPGRGPCSYEENLARIHPDDRKRVADADKNACRNNIPIDRELRIIRTDGEVRTLYERAEPVPDHDGRPIRFIGTVRDITDLKATEARLRESDERYALATRGADVGLFDWDYNSDRAYFSSRLVRILDMTSAELGSTMSNFLVALPPEDAAEFKAYLSERFARHRRRFELNVRRMTAGNKLRWLTIGGLIVYAGRRPIRLVGSVRDVTDRKWAQEQLERQREALYQNEKMAMFGSLLAGVAHELNNPLSVVTGQIALLEKTTKDQGVIKRTERIRNAADRCARIVRTFLAMARQRHIDPKAVEIKRVVEMAVELLAFQLRTAGVAVKLDLDPKVPIISADADQLHQVLTNLIMNAMQAPSIAGRRREILVSTRLDQRAGHVELKVSDNGPGIAKELHSKVFDPFFTTKPVGEGTGIGLSLCASVIRAHAGRIAVSDREGGGALFTITLPLGAVAMATAREEVKNEPLSTGLRVLIVDDDREVGDTLSEILTHHGHKTDIAVDGLEGLRMANLAQYDLILSDMRMPALSGPEFYDELKRQKSQMADKVAFITGDTLSVEIHSFLNQTGAPYLEKPFQPQDVLNLVAQTMERQRKANEECRDRKGQNALAS